MTAWRAGVRRGALAGLSTFLTLVLAGPVYAGAGRFSTADAPPTDKIVADVKAGKQNAG